MQAHALQDRTALQHHPSSFSVLPVLVHTSSSGCFFYRTRSIGFRQRCSRHRRSTQSCKPQHCLLQEMNQRLREQAQQEDREYAGSLTVLIDISFELLAPFKDLRRVNLRDLSITEAFWLLSGETEDTLKPGRRVQATVQGLSAMAAFCTLPDVRDMEAVISSSDISSSGDVRPDSRLRRGDTIPARSAGALFPCRGFRVLISDRVCGVT